MYCIPWRVIIFRNYSCISYVTYFIIFHLRPIWMYPGRRKPPLQCNSIQNHTTYSPWGKCICKALTFPVFISLLFSLYLCLARPVCLSFKLLHPMAVMQTCKKVLLSFHSREDNTLKKKKNKLSTTGCRASYLSPPETLDHVMIHDLSFMESKHKSHIYC